MVADDSDKQLLLHLDRNCRTPMTDLAAELGKSRQSLEYRIQRLVRQGIITGFTISINPHKLGLRIYKLYLKLRNIPSEKQKLFSQIRASKRAWWMGECSGSWDLVIAFFARTDYEFYYLKNDLLNKFTKIVVESKIESLLDAHQFEKRFREEDAPGSTIVGGEIVSTELDEIEFGMIDTLVQDARTPITTLAKQLHVSPPVIRHKLHHLEEAGVIVHYRINVDMGKLGYSMYKTIITFDHYVRSDEASILAYISRFPQVMFFIRNLGNMELEFMVRDDQEYYEILEAIKREFPYLMLSVDSVLMLTDEWMPGYTPGSFQDRLVA